MLAAMGLDRRPRRRARKADVFDAIRRMRVLQIDTISVVARSPYLVLFSRLGRFEPRWLDELLAEGALFEYWAHEASFLPIEDFALFRHRMIDPGGLGWKYSHEWVTKHHEDVERVRTHIRENGAVRSAELGSRPPGAAGWWGWKPEKRALEMLFSAGDVMIARREKFQRVYDLRERILPDWDDAQLPPAEEVERTLTLRAVEALGVASAAWVGDYFRTKRRAAADRVRALAASGLLTEVHVDGWRDIAYVHPVHLPLLEEAVAGRLRPTLTTFLSPFDPLVWDRVRVAEAFGFDYRLECYTPAHKRVFGYFVLPLLRRGQLAGRMDAKAHRARGEFEVKVLHLEPRARPTEALARDTAGALKELAAWHGTPEVRVRRTVPAGFRSMVKRSLAEIA
jgi:hypothetical protein